jgi:SnoaL-like domain
MKTRSGAGRRGFIGSASAAVAGMLAWGASQAAAGTPAQPAADALRALHREYLRRLNTGALDQLSDLFSSSACVWFNGGIFEGRERGIRRLFVEHFGKRLRPEPAHLSLLDRPHAEDFIEVASDGAFARARFHCLVQVQSTLQSTLTLIEMARQQGHGAVQWWEMGCFDNTYARSDEGWHMTGLRYRSLPHDLIDAGLRSSPGHVPTFSACYPSHPAGPDRLEPSVS